MHSANDACKCHNAESYAKMARNRSRVVVVGGINIKWLRWCEEAGAVAVAVAAAERDVK